MISKGKGYNEKINKRKAVIYSQMQSTKVSGKTQGASNLSAKRLNEKKYLKNVVGMALTQAQKKKLKAKLKKEKDAADALQRANGEE